MGPVVQVSPPARRRGQRRGRTQRAGQPGPGHRFEPNQRATTTELFDGLKAESQNHWPSLDFDVGAINNAVALSAGGLLLQDLHPSPPRSGNTCSSRSSAQSAGLGKAPKDRDPDSYEHFYAHVDVLVVGGGIAGLQAALTAAAAGARCC